MEIRVVRREDIPELSLLASASYIDAFKEHTQPHILKTEIEETRSENYFESILDSDFILVAVIDNELVGYLQFGKVDHEYVEHDDKDIDLKRLYVLTKFHSQGIGSALMEAFLSFENVSLAPRIFLNVWDINTKAIAFYKRYGFIPTGKKYPYFHEGQVIGYDDIYIRSNK